jgi:hypothetical protein
MVGRLALSAPLEPDAPALTEMHQPDSLSRGAGEEKLIIDLKSPGKRPIKV